MAMTTYVDVVGERMQVDGKEMMMSTPSRQSTDQTWFLHDPCNSRQDVFF